MCSCDWSSDVCSSDLMMTGRKPESLIDKSTMTWKWHQWVPTLTPWFAKILNKMLSRVPNSRYQSATEVAQALRSVSDFVGAAAENSGGFAPASGVLRQTGIDRPATVPLSRLGRTTSLNSSTSQSKLQPQQNPLRGIFNSPWGVGLGAAAAAMIVIVIPMIVISRSMTTPGGSVKQPQQTGSSTPPPPQVAANPTVPTPPSVTPADPAPTPAATTLAAAATAETLSLEVDKPTVKEGILTGAQPIAFRLTPTAGQQLKTTLISIPAGATMNVIAPNATGTDTVAKSTVNWQGLIPTAGEYRIEIIPLATTATSNYRLEVNLISATPATPPPATPGSTPPVSPAVTPAPAVK